VTGRRVQRLLLQAAGHPVMEARRVRQQMRVETTADHGGELVVRGAKVRPEQAADVGGVALERGVMLMQARRRRRVVMVMRGDERVQVFVVLLLLLLLLLRPAVMNRRAGLLAAGRAFVMTRWTVLAGDGSAGDRHCRRCRRRGLMLLMLLVLVVLPAELLLLVLEPLLPAQVAAVLEHVAAVRVQRPERALAGLVGCARHLDEAVVETERMPDRVLPALLVLPVKREQVHDELIDLRQRQHLVRRVLYRHRDQADIRVRRLRVGVAAPVRLVAAGALERRVRRVRLRQGERVAVHPGAAAGGQRAVTDGAHAGAARAHRRPAVAAHPAAAHRRHTHGRAHGAHVEAAGALRAATGPDPDPDPHRHPHRHAAHRVYRAVRGRHAAHAGHRGAGHGTRIAVQFLRLEHGHRARRSGLLPRRCCQTGVMKSAIPRLLMALGYSLNFLTGQSRTACPSDCLAFFSSTTQLNRRSSRRSSSSRRHRSLPEIAQRTATESRRRSRGGYSLGIFTEGYSKIHPGGTRLLASRARHEYEYTERYTEPRRRRCSLHPRPEERSVTLVVATRRGNHQSPPAETSGEHTTQRRRATEARGRDRFFFLSSLFSMRRTRSVCSRSKDACT